MQKMRIAYFAMRYPTLSQTFIQREVEALCRLGLQLEVHPLWDLQPSKESNVSIRRLSALDYLIFPFRVAVEIWINRRWLPTAFNLLRTHWPKFGEGWFMCLWGTAFALYKRSEFARNPPDRFHGAWATGPATTAAVLATLLDRPFSFGAHAYDIRRHGGDPLLDIKLRHAKFVHTTTRENIEYLRSRVPAANIVLSRRGLPQLPTDPGTRTMHEPVRLLSVGRLVEKKAHIHQFNACAELRNRGIAFELKIAGDGPLHTPLQAALEELKLTQQVILLGAKSPAEISELYTWADIFWHTGIVDSQGDRDGLPNVVPEAMSYRLPVISCLAPGVTEAVEHNQTGLVVETSDALLLADAVVRLRNDSALSARLGDNAREWVAENFLSEANAMILRQAFSGPDDA